MGLQTVGLTYPQRVKWNMCDVSAQGVLLETWFSSFFYWCLIVEALYLACIGSPDSQQESSLKHSVWENTSGTVSHSYLPFRLPK